MPSQRAAAARSDYLTDFARGIMPDILAAQDPILLRLAPIAKVGTATGRFKRYNDKNAFQPVNTNRPLGGNATRLEFDASDGTYACRPQALDTAIDDTERDENGDDGQDIEEAKTRTLLSVAAASHAADVVAAARTLTAAATPSWVDAAAATPIADIDAQIQAIADDIGMFPTDIVFGLSAWRRFRIAAQVRQSFPNASAVGVSTEQAGGILLNPSIRVGVTTLIRDANRMGAAKSTANVLANDVFIFYTSPNPTQYDASFMKTFMVSGGIDQVTKYRDSGARSDIIGVDWNRDVQVVSTISARRLTVTV